MIDSHRPFTAPRPKGRSRNLRSWLTLLLTGLFVAAALHPAEAAPDDNWSSAFGLPGLINDVRVMVNWSGTLVIAGDLQYAGGTRVRNIVRWGGSGFVQMGNGLNGRVTSLAVVGGVLYAAGDFDSSGTTPLPHVARWTGSAWAAVGAAAPDNTDELRLAADGSTLLLLGAFTSIGSPPVAATHIARWNGAIWSDVGGFPGAASGSVAAAARVGGTLYAGSGYDESGCFHVFDGSSWTTSDRIIDGIRGMATIGSTLYILGDFSAVDYGNVPADQVVSFDGSDFADLGGVSFDGSSVEYIGVDNGELLAVGGFAQPHAKTAYWDGVSWDAGPASSGTNLDGSIRTFARVGSEIILGGTMSRFYDAVSGKFEAAWRVIGDDGGVVSAVQPGGGLSAGGFGAGWVQSLALYGGRLIAGGEITRIGTLGDARGIAGWDGAEWTSIGNGLNQTVGFAIADELGVWNGRLVVSGSLTGGGAVNSLNIVSWDGTNWIGFDGGFTCQGANVIDYAGTLIAAGTNGFGLGTAIGTGQPLGHVARWTGTQWQTIGTVTPTSGVEGDVVVWNGKLVYGATITTMNGVAVNNIAQWNGTTWSAIGSGFNGFVIALAVFNGDLYASGNFTQSGATALPGFMARWNGSAWVAVGSGVESVPFALAATADRLYATGNFVTAGGSPAMRIAAWDGTSWSPLGSGLGEGELGDGEGGTCLQTWGDSLFVGGFFNTAGDKYSSNVARWWEPNATDVRSDADAAPSGLRLTAAPNPVVRDVRLTFDLPRTGRVEAAIFDVSGRRVRVLSDGTLQAGRQVLTWDGLDDSGRRAASGVYQASVNSASMQENVRVVLVR